MSEEVSSSRVQYREHYAKYAVIRRNYTSNVDSYTSISNWICIEDAAQWYWSCGWSTAYLLGTCDMIHWSCLSDTRHATGQFWWTASLPKNLIGSPFSLLCGVILFPWTGLDSCPCFQESSQLIAAQAIWIAGLCLLIWSALHPLESVSNANALSLAHCDMHVTSACNSGRAYSGRTNIPVKLQHDLSIIVGHQVLTLLVTWSILLCSNAD